MTFAPLGGCGRAGKPVGIVWNEYISVRYDEDVTSTYVKYITYCMRDCSVITFLVDNCSPQNTNWTLFTTFVQVVNDDTIFVKKSH